MAHAAKYAASASGHLAKHYERAKEFNAETKEWEYVKFGNQSIDPSRTHLNYNLAPDRAEGQVEFLRQRTSEVRCMKRDDVKVMCSWIVTLPKYESMDKSRHVTPKKDQVERLFFERCYSFMEQRYGGAKNVISAYVHMDEVTPHIHFAFIPIVKDKKRGGEKVSAKEVLTRDDLANFHVDLERHLDSFKDWHFEVINEATKDGNKDIAQLKIESAHAEVVEAQKEAQKAREEVNALRDTKKALEGEISALQTVKEELTSAEAKALKLSKTIGGGVKGMTYKEAIALQAAAVKRDEAEAARAEAELRADAAIRRAERAEQRADAAERTVDQAVANANARLAAGEKALEARWGEMLVEIDKERKSDPLGNINKQLNRQVKRLQKAVDFLLGVIKEYLPSLHEKFSAKAQRIMDGKDENTLAK